MIPEDKLQELRERVRIEEVIGKYVELRPSGRQFKALCPFHQERTPSFYVHPERRSFKCFGCGVYGDAIEFVSKVEGISFIETVQRLADQFGVSLPSSGSSPRRQEETAEREQALKINDLAAKLYRRILLDTKSSIGDLGREYVRSRQIADDTSEAFRVGYAPAPAEAGWDTLVREIERAGLSLELAEKIGLVGRSERTGKHFDKLRGRLVFPIVRPGGSVIGFSARILPAHEQPAPDGSPPPKYVNSPESVVFKKSKTLFGLQLAGQAMRRAGRAILVEGNVDVLAMHQRDHPETVAPLGTALTPDQCQLLRRFTEKVVICFDGDRAGAKAARAAIPMLLEADLEARVVQLEPGADPDSTPAEQLDNLLRRPEPALEWFMRRMVAAGAKESIESRARALRAVVPLLRRVKGRDARGDYAVLASNLLEIPVRRIWNAMEGVSSQEPGEPDRSRRRARLPPLPTGQADLVALLVDKPLIAERAQEMGALDHVQDRRLRPIAERVVEAALAGEPQPGVGELLELVEPRAQRQVFDQIFSGRFADVERPEALLGVAIKRCQISFIDRQIAELDASSSEARRRGDQDALREHQLAKVELRRRQADLERELRGAPLH